MGIRITRTGAWAYNEGTYDRTKFFDKGAANFIANLIEGNYTLFDFGCGSGDYIKFLQSANPNATLLGVEPYNNQQKDITIINADLTQPFKHDKRGHVMCIEVLEHIPKEYEEIAVNTLVEYCNGFLIISWARKGQPGYGHVNCKDWDEVRALFEEKGMVFLEEETTLIRNSARLTTLRNNLCIFRK